MVEKPMCFEDWNAKRCRDYGKRKEDFSRSGATARRKRILRCAFAPLREKLLQ
jgi:hypothetical protein